MAKNETKKKGGETKTPRELILKTLDRHRLLRNKDLLAALANTGYGRATIARHLAKLLKTREIATITHEEFSRYGIEIKDEKAVYYTTKRSTEQARYHDDVIAAFSSKNAAERQHALIEIEGFGEVTLIPKQLLDLSKALAIGEMSEAYAATRVLKKHAEKGIFPSDKETFQEYLIKGYQRFRQLPLNQGENSNLRGNILMFLAHYENPIFFTFLKTDLQADKELDYIRDLYDREPFYEIISNHPALLFNLAKELNPQTREILAEIRSTCKQGLAAQKKGKGGITPRIV